MAEEEPQAAVGILSERENVHLSISKWALQRDMRSALVAVSGQEVQRP